MELSIIAVVIDNLEVTKRFVSSIRQYTKGKYELVLIDNGSKNKKAIQYFKKSADKYFRFPKITDLAKAWNKGIELSKGKYVAVVNNDTVVPPNWFKLLKETLDKNKKAGMVSPITYWLIKGYFSYGNLRNFDKTFSKPFKLMKFKDVVMGEFCVFKRKALKAVGGYSEIYHILSGEDLEMCFQLYSNGYDICVDPRVFVYHQGGASRIKSIISKKRERNIYQKNFKLFKSRWPKYTKGWK
ncbi:glycosyltransferase [Candidatus Woesearchaeota archaeon]|nr:glycosyltransferase [Candidatus Woesearchaeota archaeon]